MFTGRRLSSVRRALALLAIVCTFLVLSLVASVRVPLTIVWVHRRHRGADVLPSVMVPVVIVRTRGLFRTTGKMVPLTVVVRLRASRTTLLCGLCSIPRAANAIILVHGIGSGTVPFVIRLTKRVVLITSMVLILLETLWKVVKLTRCGTVELL